MGGLAIDGGTPLRTRPYLSWPCYDDAERAALTRALENTAWGRLLPEGGEAAAFEAEFAACHGAPAGLAVSNGTHALQLAMEMLGVGFGDEVIVPAFMPVPPSNAVRQRGATPVPVDVDPLTYCLDPAQLDAARSPRTKAVIAVHLGGHVADMDMINDWARGTGVAVIQDAAHAHGASWRDAGLGGLGTLVTFSFQQAKLMTAGEGGAVLLPSQAMFENAYSRHRLGAYPPGLPVTASSNYRLSEFAAALLRAQLARLPIHNEQRVRRWGQLSAMLSAIPGVVPQGQDPRCTLNPRYLPAFVLDPDRYAGLSRDQVVRSVRAEGIPIRPMFPPVYHFAAYWDGPVSGLPSADEMATACPVSERLGAWGMYVGHEVLLGDEQDVRDAADAVQKVLDVLTAGAFTA